MNKYTYLLLILTIIHVEKSFSQNSQAAAAMAGVGIAAAITSISIEQVKEQLELNATEHLLANEPSFNKFSIEVMDLTDGVRLSDLSNISCVPFKVKRFDNSLNVTEKSVLLMFTSRGWINQSGVNISYVRFKLLNSVNWNQLILGYSAIASNIKLDLKNIDRVPCLSSVSKKEFIENDTNYYKITTDGQSTNYYKVVYLPMKKLRLTGRSLEFHSPENPKLPFLKIDGDSYLVGDYSDEFKLIYNEKTMGIYLIELKRLVQLKRSTINLIHDFVNDRVASEYE